MKVDRVPCMLILAKVFAFLALGCEHPSSEVYAGTLNLQSSIMTSVETISGDVVFGVSKTRDTHSHIWAYDIASDKLRVLYSDREATRKIQGIVSGSSNAGLLWSGFESNATMMTPQVEYFFLRPEELLDDHAPGTGPWRKILAPIEFQGIPLGILDRGRYILTDLFGSQNGYSLWDTSIMQVVKQHVVKRRSFGIFVSDVFGLDNDLVVVGEASSGLIRKNRVRLVLFRLDPFVEIASTEIEKGLTIYPLADRQKDSILIGVRRGSEVGISKLSIAREDDSVRLLVAETEWIPDPGAMSPNWRAGKYYWVMPGRDAGELNLAVAGSLARDSNGQILIPIVSAGTDWSWHYRLLEQGNGVVICGGGDSFEIWRVSGADSARVRRVYFDYSSAGTDAPALRIRTEKG